MVGPGAGWDKYLTSLTSCSGASTLVRSFKSISPSCKCTKSQAGPLGASALLLHSKEGHLPMMELPKLRPQKALIKEQHHPPPPSEKHDHREEGGMAMGRREAWPWGGGRHAHWGGGAALASLALGSLGKTNNRTECVPHRQMATGSHQVAIVCHEGGQSGWEPGTGVYGPWMSPPVSLGSLRDVKECVQLWRN